MKIPTLVLPPKLWTGRGECTETLFTVERETLFTVERETQFTVERETQFTVELETRGNWLVTA